MLKQTITLSTILPHIDFYIQIQIMQKIVLFDIGPAKSTGGYYKHAQQYAFFADLLSALSIF